MTGQLSAQVLEIIRKMQQNELTESVIYEKIAVQGRGKQADPAAPVPGGTGPL